MTRDSERKVTFAVVVGAFVFGTNLFVVKIGTSYMPQLPLMATAISLAGIIMLTVCLAFRKGPAILSGKKYFLELLWIGVIGTSVPALLVAYGVSFSGVTNCMLLQTEVVFSMALGYIFLRENVTREQISLCAFSFLGAFLVLTNGVITNVDFGGVLLLMAPLFYQMGHVVAKRVLRDIDHSIVVTYRLLIGGFFLTAASSILWRDAWTLSTGISESVVTVLLALGYALGNTLWYYGVRHLNLSKATSLLVVQPLVPTILGVLLLGETLSMVKVWGIVLVFLALLRLSQIRSVSR